jgi:competence protein ComEC
VAPRVAVIEVGAHNTYGHPAPQALQALAGARVPVVARTDRDGTVRLDLDGGRWRVHTRQ